MLLFLELGYNLSISVITLDAAFLLLSLMRLLQVIWLLQLLVDCDLGLGLA